MNWVLFGLPFLDVLQGEDVVEAFVDLQVVPRVVGVHLDVVVLLVANLDQEKSFLNKKKSLGVFIQLVLPQAVQLGIHFYGK